MLRADQRHSGGREGAGRERRSERISNHRGRRGDDHTKQKRRTLLGLNWAAQGISNIVRHFSGQPCVVRVVPGGTPTPRASNGGWSTLPTGEGGLVAPCGAILRPFRWGEGLRGTLSGALHHPFRSRGGSKRGGGGASPHITTARPSHHTGGSHGRGRVHRGSTHTHMCFPPLTILSRTRKTCRRKSFQTVPSPRRAHTVHFEVGGGGKGRGSDPPPSAPRASISGGG